MGIALLRSPTVRSIESRPWGDQTKKDSITCLVTGKFEDVDKVDTLSQKCKHFFDSCSLVHARTAFVALTSLIREKSDAHVVTFFKFHLIPFSNDNGTLRGSCIMQLTKLLFQQSITCLVTGKFFFYRLSATYKRLPLMQTAGSAARSHSLTREVAKIGDF